jgi:hypothetical protein
MIMSRSFRKMAATLSVLAAFLGLTLLAATHAWAQAETAKLEQQVVGTWRLAAIYNEVDGVKTHLYGDKPVGLTMYDSSGHVMQFLAKPELPKFAVSNRLKGTNKEYRDVMQGMLSGFGAYTVEGNTITIKWVASSYPNRAGTTEKRAYKIAGDELSVVNPTAAGGGTSYSRYVRVK